MDRIGYLSPKDRAAERLRAKQEMRAERRRIRSEHDNAEAERRKAKAERRAERLRVAAERKIKTAARLSAKADKEKRRADRAKEAADRRKTAEVALKLINERKCLKKRQIENDKDAILKFFGSAAESVSDEKLNLLLRYLKPTSRHYIPELAEHIEARYGFRLSLHLRSNTRRYVVLYVRLNHGGLAR